MLKLNNPLQGYLARFRLGENLRDSMDPRSFRRVRSSLIAAGGPDIAERFPEELLDQRLELPRKTIKPVTTLVLNGAQRVWLDGKRLPGESRGAALRRLAGIPDFGMRVRRSAWEAHP